DSNDISSSYQSQHMPASTRSLTWQLLLEVDNDPSGEARLYLVFTEVRREDWGTEQIHELDDSFHMFSLASAPLADFNADWQIGAWAEAVNKMLVRNALPILCSHLSFYAEDIAHRLLGDATGKPPDLKRLEKEHMAKVRSYVRHTLGLRDAGGALPVNQRSLTALLLEAFAEAELERFKGLTVAGAVAWAHRILIKRHPPELVPRNLKTFEKNLRRRKVDMDVLKRATDAGQAKDLLWRVNHGLD